MSKDNPEWRPKTPITEPRANCSKGVHDAVLVHGTHRCRWCGVLLSPMILPVRKPKDP